MKARGEHLRQAMILTAAVWGVTYALFLLYAVISSGRLSGPTAVVNLVLALSGALITTGVFIGLRKTEGMRPGARIPLLGVLILALGALQAGMDAGLEQNLHHFLPRHQPMANLRDYYGNMVTLYTEIYALCATAMALMQSTLAGRERERQLAEARATAQQAQLAALRLQLSPHFLFNTLNALSTLIVTGRTEDADAMVCMLSEFLRSSLTADPDLSTPLSEELGVVQTYLQIEEIRFGERLAVEIECPPTLSEALVPGFLLQPLVENAVKYAVAPSRRPVTIRIGAAREGGDLVLTVEDDGSPEASAQVPPGTGVGLANVRRRLEVLYGSAGGLETGLSGAGYRAVVRLPLTRRRATAAA